MQATNFFFPDCLRSRCVTALLQRGYTPSNADFDLIGEFLSSKGVTLDDFDEIIIPNAIILHRTCGERCSCVVACYVRLRSLWDQCRDFALAEVIRSAHQVGWTPVFEDLFADGDHLIKLLLECESPLQLVRKYAHEEWLDHLA